MNSGTRNKKGKEKKAVAVLPERMRLPVGVKAQAEMVEVLQEGIHNLVHYMKRPRWGVFYLNIS